jgi:hypothetical protein
VTAGARWRRAASVSTRCSRSTTGQPSASSRMVRSAWHGDNLVNLRNRLALHPGARARWADTAPRGSRLGEAFVRGSRFATEIRQSEQGWPPSWRLAHRASHSGHSTHSAHPHAAARHRKSARMSVSSIPASSSQRSVTGPKKVRTIGPPHWGQPPGMRPVLGSACAIAISPATTRRRPAPRCGPVCA